MRASRPAPVRFETPEDVTRALRRYSDIFDPKTGSIIMPSGPKFDPGAEPFRPGFLSWMEERAELVHRMMTRLRSRDRLLLVLWYVSDLPVAKIARSVRVSRMHCYRLRKDALGALCDEPPEGGEAARGVREGTQPAGRRTARVGD